MKLLIADDEELTRIGVITSLDWKSLGVDEILQADDGLHALEMARKYRPEIILCDVRMPRMDGITMLQELGQTLPDSVAIFMSGYSDKEYLKAAIRLKAANYIEKPLNPSEIREAFLAAKELYWKKVRSHRGESLYSMEASSRLARQLAAPYGANKGQIRSLADELSLHFTEDTFFTTLIVRPGASSDNGEPPADALFLDFRDFLEAHALKSVYTEKHRQYNVYCIFGEQYLAPELLSEIGIFLGGLYAPYGKYMAAAGDTLRGLPQAYASYTSAVVVLQSCFFFPENTFLMPQALQQLPPHPALPDSLEARFYQALTGHTPEDCRTLLEQLFAYFFQNCAVFQNQAKDLYYKLLLSLEDARRQMQLDAEADSGNIVDILESCFNFQELHEILTVKTREFFFRLEHSVRENPTIHLIKEYIGKNYANELLSVKDIGDHVFLSASYVCTFFKNETGQTLNQYLTQYRMEKAKQLLADPRYRITDISAKVGYSDSNYFGKSFRKYCGLSPSEYRERAL